MAGSPTSYYDRALGMVGPSSFEFNPMYGDPELVDLRLRTLTEGSRRRGRTINEIARAGLTGTSASFGLMGEQDRELSQMLSGVEAGALGRQRREQLDLYTADLEWRRRMAQDLIRQQQMADYQAEMEDKRGMWGSIGGLGKGLGYGAARWLLV